MRDEVKNTLGVPESKISVIPNGVNPLNIEITDSKTLRSRYAAPWEKIVLYVGRLVYEKGPQVLLEAAARILSRRRDIKFVFVGEGVLKDKLVKRAKDMGILEKTYFTGFIDDNELATLYHISDVAVFPSLYEPFGIVVLEAMWAGTPVIVSDVGGPAEYVENGVTGVKVPPQDPEALAAAIESLLDNKEYAYYLSRNGLKKAREEFTWENIGRKTVEIYREVLKEYSEAEWKPGFSLSRRNQL